MHSCIQRILLSSPLFAFSGSTYSRMKTCSCPVEWALSWAVLPFLSRERPFPSSARPSFLSSHQCLYRESKLLSLWAPVSLCSIQTFAHTGHPSPLPQYLAQFRGHPHVCLIIGLPDHLCLHNLPLTVPLASLSACDAESPTRHVQSLNADQMKTLRGSCGAV